jgi:hypothetical protein
MYLSKPLKALKRFGAERLSVEATMHPGVSISAEVGARHSFERSETLASFKAMNNYPGCIHSCSNAWMLGRLLWSFFFHPQDLGRTSGDLALPVT